jgi:hypothetical protein
MDRFLALFCRNPGFQFPLDPRSPPIPGSPLFQQAGAANGDGTDTPQEENLMGSVFTSLYYFWSLVHDGLWIYYADRPNAPPTRWRHKLTEHKYREIIAWRVHHIPLPTDDEEQRDPHVPVIQYEPYCPTPPSPFIRALVV